MKIFPLYSQDVINDRSDMFGAFASGLCLIHCLVTPLIFVAQACTTSCCATGPTWWGMIDYLFLGISIIAIYYSAKSTSIKWMPIALYASWLLLAICILNERFGLFHVNQFVNYVPAIGLVGLHLYNRKYCQCDDDKCLNTEPLPQS
ncbi:MAG: MerC domain-containing protein [Bacteroidota bacterium]